MEKYQIQAILDDLGYNMNTMIPLREVNAIVLEGNMNLYPDDHTRFFFKSSGNIGLVLGYRGSVNKDGEFIAKAKPAYAVPFDQVEGFQLTSDSRPYAPYMFARSM